MKLRTVSALVESKASKIAAALPSGYAVSTWIQAVIMRRFSFQLLALSLAICIVGQVAMHAQTAPVAVPRPDTSTAPSASAATDKIPAGPLSEYGDKITEILRRDLKVAEPPKDENDSIKIDFKINAKGVVSDVVNKTKKRLESHKALLEQIGKMGPFDPPPKASLLMHLSIGTKLSEMQANPDVDFGKFMADLQRRIKLHWNPPKRLASKRVKVTFKVYRSGRIDELKLAHKSGDRTADDAAMEAIKQTGPVAKLPDGAPPDIAVEFTFDYNVFHSISDGLDSSVPTPAKLLTKDVTTPRLEYLAKASISNNQSSPWVATPDLGNQDFINAMQERISKNWNPQPDWKNKEAHIDFVLDKDGKVSELKVQKGEVSGSFETAAMKAIEASAPFAPPDADAPNTVHFQVWF